MGILTIVALLDNVAWVDVIPAGFAIAILGSAMVMLISGVWASRDQ